MLTDHIHKRFGPCPGNDSLLFSTSFCRIPHGFLLVVGAVDGQELVAGEDQSDDATHGIDDLDVSSDRVDH